VLPLEPIGVVRTSRTDPADTPVQAAANLDEEAVVVLAEAYGAALDGLDGFSHAWLLTWLGAPGHRAAAVELHQRPFLRPGGPALGIFAMRGPRRPNPIGLSLVEIVEVTGTEVRFRGVDIVDGTPLLDIKPYFADADEPHAPIRCGWFDEIAVPSAATPSSLRSNPADISASRGGFADIVSRTLPGAFGAIEVRGLDPAEHASDDVVRQWVQALLWRHGVVCLRLDRELTDLELRAVVALLGDVKDPVGDDDNGEAVRYGDERQIIDAGFVLTDDLREALGDLTFGGDDERPGLFQFFHTDDSYVTCPAVATVLHARELPPGGGGDTQFIDMRDAYARLQADERDRVIGRLAEHAYNNDGAFPPRESARGELEVLRRVAHPIVRAHPVTGVPALYFDLDRATHIEGMPVEEGRALLQALQDHAEQHAARYSHRWRDHDVLLWDNVCVQHRASGDFEIGAPRRFWRYMVAGPAPRSFVPESS
jgi:tRNA (adenine37-N6)-methyltransferase